MMATAGKICIAEVEEIVDELDADNIHTPGIYIDRLFVGSFEKRIEQRTVKN
jgi:3-oxoacid CoA-transferase subunit A